VALDGCEEILNVDRCVECGASWFDVLHDSWEGPSFTRTRHIPTRLGDLIDATIARCAKRDKTCHCAAHEMIERVWSDSRRGPDGQTPWSDEEATREKLAPVWTKSMSDALTLAKRVHAEQVRDDGTSYLCEHVFPVTVDVADYLMSSQPADVEVGVRVALVHDALEDLDWALPPLSIEEALDVMDVAIRPLAHVLAKSTLPPGLSKTEKQARYMERLRGAPDLARIVKMFDRINNLSCLHKSDRKGVDYVEESRHDYLPLADGHDARLGDRMQVTLGQATARLAARLARNF
jgi:GTP pyrophosphokinase